MFFFFFFNDTATTEIYTLSLHDALPICAENVIQHERWLFRNERDRRACVRRNIVQRTHRSWRDRKSTRLNSSHSQISYAVFCLKKKKKRSDPIWFNPITI